MLIWDCAGPPPITDGAVVCWRGDDAGAVSVLALVEASADRIRRRYLAWIYALGHAPFANQTAIEKLKLHAGESYWWMTLLFEKCNFEKSPHIDEAVKLMAFADWACERPVEAVHLVSANRALAECLRRWCAGRGGEFTWQFEPGERLPPRPLLRRFFDALPPVLRVVAWLARHVVRRWPLRNIGVSAWKASEARLCFISYLFNMVPSALAAGNYGSRYWGTLPDMLNLEHCKSNWLHLYIEGDQLADARKAAAAIRQFNRAALYGETHTTLDSFLGCAVLYGTLRDWVRIALRAVRLEQDLATITSEGLSVWPLFAAEWREATAGPIAIANLLQLNQMRASLKVLPTQRMGVYLQENQAWEFGLLQAWRNARHGHMVGCPHSTVRYWDLRHFFDSREYRGSHETQMPRPDCVAVNGEAAREAYLEGGYPADELVDVEALRYQHLAAPRSLPAQRVTAARLRLLVLGDYAPRHTHMQLTLLAQAVKTLASEIEIIVKPHPACPVDIAAFLDLPMAVTMQPIDALLGECDAALVSAVTSAAIDAYCADVPVIAVRDAAALNLSPLRGKSDVRFIITAEELSVALRAVSSEERLHTKRVIPFYLDPAMPRWRRLLLGQAITQ